MIRRISYLGLNIFYRPINFKIYFLVIACCFVCFIIYSMYSYVAIYGIFKIYILIESFVQVLDFYDLGQNKSTQAFSEYLG